MPFGEVYASLQTGVVNAAENGIDVYMANKRYEVAPVLPMTEHEANNNAIWVSEKAWSGLSDRRRSGCQAAAEEVGRVEPAKALALETRVGGKLKKMGVEVVEKVDKAGFVKAAQPVQGQLAKELGPASGKIPGLIREIQCRADHRALVLQRHRHLKWPALDPRSRRR